MEVVFFNKKTNQLSFICPIKVVVWQPQNQNKSNGHTPSSQIVLGSTLVHPNFSEAKSRTATKFGTAHVNFSVELSMSGSKYAKLIRSLGNDSGTCNFLSFSFNFVPGGIAGLLLVSFHQDLNNFSGSRPFPGNSAKI